MHGNQSVACLAQVVKKCGFAVAAARAGERLERGESEPGRGAFRRARVHHVSDGEDRLHHRRERLRPPNLLGKRGDGLELLRQAGQGGLELHFVLQCRKLRAPPATPFRSEPTLGRPCLSFNIINTQCEAATHKMLVGKGSHRGQVSTVSIKRSARPRSCRSPLYALKVLASSGSGTNLSIPAT